MQNYAIFNKFSKIFIAKMPFNGEKIPNNKIIHCNSENLDNLDFASFFKDNIRGTYLFLAEDIDAKKIIEKIKYQIVFVKAAGGIVENEDGDILFMQRNGKWDLPKGHWEEGETLAITAKREVMEETGLKNIDEKEYLISTYHSYFMHGRRELKKTDWYRMFASKSENLVPQTEEGITKLVWIKRNDVDNILKESYPSIQYIFENINL